MAKEVVKKIKLQLEAGKATPAPPVGTVLGPAGVNLQDFCSKFNEATRDKMGDVVPCEISIYDDRSFTFVLKTPPAAFLLKKVAKIKSGASKGETVATITREQLREIAETKLPDLNAYDIESAIKALSEAEDSKMLFKAENIVTPHFTSVNRGGNNGGGIKSKDDIYATDDKGRFKYTPEQRAQLIADNPSLFQ